MHFAIDKTVHSLVFTRQGTCVGEVSNLKGTGTGVVDGACKNRESTAAKTLGRLTERQQQEASRQVESPEGASPSRPFLQEGLATVVLMAALVCRLGDYLQASFCFVQVFILFRNMLVNILYARQPAQKSFHPVGEPRSKVTLLHAPFFLGGVDAISR